VPATAKHYGYRGIMTEQKQKNLIESLQRLIDEQLKLMRQGSCDSARLEQIERQTDVLAGRIAQAKIFEQEKFTADRQKMQRTYNELCLAIRAEQEQVKEAIETVRKGKKAISVYQKNL